MIIIRSRTILARRKFPLNSGGRNRRFEMDVDNNIGSDMKILRFVNFFFFLFSSAGWNFGEILDYEYRKILRVMLR